MRNPKHIGEYRKKLKIRDWPDPMFEKRAKSNNRPGVSVLREMVDYHAYHWEDGNHGYLMSEIAYAYLDKIEELEKRIEAMKK